MIPVFRGCAYGLLFAAPLWAVILFVCWVLKGGGR